MIILNLNKSKQTGKGCIAADCLLSPKGHEVIINLKTEKLDAIYFSFHQSKSNPTVKYDKYQMLHAIWNICEIRVAEQHWQGAQLILLQNLFPVRVGKERSERGCGRILILDNKKNQWLILINNYKDRATSSSVIYNKLTCQQWWMLRTCVIKLWTHYLGMWFMGPRCYYHFHLQLIILPFTYPHSSQ